MARCSNCRHHFRTLEDEADMHECPKCGYHPNDEREPDEDGEAFRGGEAAAHERDQQAWIQRNLK